MNPSQIEPTSEKPSLLSQFELKVLLIENSWSDQRIISKMLKARGCRVCSAENLQEAGRILKTFEIDMVLLDSSIYSRNGFDLSAVIQEAERKKGRHIPVIGLSENVLRSSRKQYLDKGMDDYLPKPVFEEELCRSMARLAENLIHHTAAGMDSQSLNEAAAG